MISLKRTTSNDPDFCRLIELLDKDLWIRYPDTQQNFVAFNHVKLDANVIVAYDDGNAAGCGCYRVTENESIIEIKRMFVMAENRGMGIAKAILLELEAWALEEGKAGAILETGTNNPEAVALYYKFGFERIENYEPYVNSDDSICMKKIF
ncbi:GNAT family N-acetyltransferase [Paenibacillus sp. FJAT-27812]|uniref:GNAT family N-acetyltransferase n=1 Tax=Paenibacillus sp. FJAT-27812 TaxID=1684143 RepID=UPI0006A7C33B|nr:GNAT family N-acetyltransferase [Paenibacillus sp. FJAT-27812]